MKKYIVLIIISMAISSNAISQTNKENKIAAEFDLGADIVSSYVWRGLLVDATPNVQGWGELAAGNFFAGLWASSNFTGTSSEVDLYAGYSIGNLSATFTDYFIGNQDAFNFKNAETSHVGELSLQYTISDNFPLQITASANIYGADMQLDSIGIDEEAYFNETRNYSSYVELMFPVSLKNIDFEFTLGGSTHESYYYDNSGAAITNIGFKAAKSIAITDKFELPIAFQLVVNPELESIYSVFTISF